MMLIIKRRYQIALTCWLGERMIRIIVCTKVGRMPVAARSFGVAQLVRLSPTMFCTILLKSIDVLYDLVEILPLFLEERLKLQALLLLLCTHLDCVRPDQGVLCLMMSSQCCSGRKGRR